GLGGEPRLQSFIECWMATNSGSAQACHIIAALIERPEQREIWMRRALEHVDANPANSGARYLFSKLAEILQSMPTRDVEDLRGTLSQGPRATLTNALRWKPKPI